MKLFGMLFLVMLLAVTSFSTPSWAVNPSEMMTNPGQELRAREISKELRCLVCQNQSIDDSDADLARDLRVLVRERISAGDTDQEVIDFVVHRYGDFVLLRPPVKGATLILWGGPAAIALFGILAVFVFLRRNRRRQLVTAVSKDDMDATIAAHDKRNGVTDSLSPSEKARLDRILSGGNR